MLYNKHECTYIFEKALYASCPKTTVASPLYRRSLLWVRRLQQNHRVFVEHMLPWNDL